MLDRIILTAFFTNLYINGGFSQYTNTQAHLNWTQTIGFFLKKNKTKMAFNV